MGAMAAAQQGVPDASGALARDQDAHQQARHPLTVREQCRNAGSERSRVGSQLLPMGVIVVESFARLL